MSAQQVKALRDRAVRDQAGRFAEAIDVLAPSHPDARALVSVNRWPVVRMTAAELATWHHERQIGGLVFVHVWDVTPMEFWVHVITPAEETRGLLLPETVPGLP